MDVKQLCHSGTVVVGGLEYLQWLRALASAAIVSGWVAVRVVARQGSALNAPVGYMCAQRRQLIVHYSYQHSAWDSRM